MKKCFISSILILLFVNQLFSATINLKYKWEKGKTYRFSVAETDNISMGGGMMMGMPVGSMKFITESVFSIKIKNVLPGGKADAVLYTEQFKVKDGSGNIIASLNDIPPEALQSNVEIDEKGNFEFKKVIYLLTTETSNVLVSGEIHEGGASATAQAGDTKLNVYAEFDPKTGNLKAGYSVEKIDQPKAKEVKLENAQKIDILPVAFLDMLKLPEEPIAENSEVKVKMLEYEFTTRVNAISGNTANIHLNITTDRSSGNTTTNIASQGAGGNSDDAGFGDMNMGGMDMPGMNMEGTETGAPSEGAVPQMDINGNIDFDFDLAGGIFSKLTGNLITISKTMGVEIKVDSAIKMNYLK